jgi:hypothetical protein
MLTYQSWRSRNHRPPQAAVSGAPGHTLAATLDQLSAILPSLVSATLENEADATLENEATGSSVSSLPCLGF